MTSTGGETFCHLIPWISVVSAQGIRGVILSMLPLQIIYDMDHLWNYSEGLYLGFYVKLSP
jgi:hypothetical protein